MDDYLTTDEAAAILDVTSEAVRYRARNGQLGAVKRGGVWWVEREKVLQLQRNQAAQDRPGPARSR